MAETRISVSCSACGQSRPAPLFRARDSDGLSDEPFYVVRCRACGSAYVDPRPETPALARYYVRGYYDKPGEDSGGAGRLLARLFMAERAAKAAAGRAPGRVLDVGCGEGTFLAAMARRGWAACGVEVSKEAAARAAARPGLRIFDGPLADSGFKPGSFDLITLWHSIEHVPDPDALLRTAAALLKEDGAMVLAFPNGESWDFRLFGPHWFHLDPPRHLHYFSPRTMGALLNRCGLKIERVGQFSLEYNPFGFAQSVLNLLTVRFNFLYRALKGTFAPGEFLLARDVCATVFLLPPLLALSLPYIFLAAMCGASGCVDVRAVRSGASAPDPGRTPAAP